MTYRTALIFSVSIFALLLTTSAAKAESLVGKPCSLGAGGTPSELGVTKMDEDKTGTVGCFLTEAGSDKAVWKAAHPVIPKTTQRRFMFTTSSEWVVPEGVHAANISMAGGGGSGLGWRISNALMTGHSGGYVFSHPVVLTPGEKLTVIVGQGGTGYPTIRSSTPAKPGPPYFIYVPNSQDNGLGGYPGTSSKVISPTAGTLLECAGGSGASTGGIDTMNTGVLIPGPQKGATIGSGNPSFPAPSRIAAGPYAKENGPGTCGPDDYGIGNPGPSIWDVTSAIRPGGTTPFGFGSGGAVYTSGCYVDFTTVGTCINPTSGRNGVVYIDVIY